MYAMWTRKLLLSSVVILCFSSLLAAADTEEELYIGKAKKALQELQRLSDQIRNWEREAAQKLRKGAFFEEALQLSKLKKWENQLLRMFPVVGKELKIYRLWISHTILSGIRSSLSLQLSYRFLLPKFPLRDEDNQILPLLLRFVYYSKELLDSSNPRWNGKEKIVEFPNLVAQLNDDDDSWVFHLKPLWKDPKLAKAVERTLQDRRQSLNSFHRWMFYSAKIIKANRQILSKLDPAAKRAKTFSASETLAIAVLTALFTAQTQFRIMRKNGRNYGDFRELKKHRLFSLGKILSPNKVKKGGYIFLLELQRASDTTSPDFKAYAYPEHPRYGSRAFLLLSSGLIHCKNYWPDKKLPTSKDPTIDEDEDEGEDASSKDSASGEASAIGTLKALFTAQTMFRIMRKNGRNYGDFRELKKHDLFTRFDKILSPNKAKKGGYIFLIELQRSSGTTSPDFKAYAYPEHPRYGSRAFVLLSDGLIRYKNYWPDKKLPTSQDPTID